MGDLKGWEWTGRRERAALLVAEDALPDADIAAQVRLTEEGLRKWKRRPEFRERVAAIREQMRQAIVARGIAERQNRVDALNERWELMRQVIRARAEAGPVIVPGAKTGLLVKTVKAIGAGKDQYEVEEWAVDTGLLRELRAHEEQAAKELGQWVQKMAPTDPTGEKEYDTLTDAEKVKRAMALLDIARQRQEQDQAH